MQEDKVPKTRWETETACAVLKCAFCEFFSLSMKREDQQDATIRCLLLTSVSTCFGHHYAHLQENKGHVAAFGVLSGSAGCGW